MYEASFCNGIWSMVEEMSDEWHSARRCQQGTGFFLNDKGNKCMMNDAVRSISLTAKEMYDERHGAYRWQ